VDRISEQEKTHFARRKFTALQPAKTAPNITVVCGHVGGNKWLRASFLLRYLRVKTLPYILSMSLLKMGQYLSCLQTSSGGLFHSGKNVRQIAARQAEILSQA